MLPTSSYVTSPPPIAPKWVQSGTADALAVELDDVKVFVNRPLEDTFWDQELERFVRVATRAVETHCRLDLTRKTWVGTLPYFYDQMRVWKRPFVGVTKIEYVDPDTGEITTLDAARYHAIPIQQDCGMIFRSAADAWPSIASRWDAVRLTVTSGYDAEDNPIPDDLMHGLMMTIAALDGRRGDQSSGGESNVTVYAMKNASGRSIIPVEARDLIQSYKLQLISVA